MRRHTDSEIQAAHNFKQLAKVLDPTTAEVESVDHAAMTRPARYRLGMAATDKITVSLDASIVAQAREQLGEPVAGLADGAVIERAISAYLLRRMVDTSQLAAGLSEEEAERVAYDELSAARQERPGSA
jgi:predicted transcriptional regulator